MFTTWHFNMRVNYWDAGSLSDTTWWLRNVSLGVKQIWDGLLLWHSPINIPVPQYLHSLKGENVPLEFQWHRMCNAQCVAQIVIPSPATWKETLTVTKTLLSMQTFPQTPWQGITKAELRHLLRWTRCPHSGPDRSSHSEGPSSYWHEDYLHQTAN